MPAEGRGLGSRSAVAVATAGEWRKPVTSIAGWEVMGTAARLSEERATFRVRPRDALSESRMREICTSGSMSGR